MKAAALVLDPARAIRRAAVLWLLAIASLVVMTVAFWPAFKNTTELTQMIDRLPSDFVQALGMQDFASPAGYLRGNLYELLVPLLLAGAAIGFANSLTASEEDSGRLELALAQPVTRQATYAGRVGAAAVWFAVVVAGIALTQLASDAFYGLSIDTARLASALVLCGLLGALHGALAFAVAGFVARPGLVLGLGLFVAFAGAIVASLFPISPVLRPWVGISPWDWALGGDPLTRPTELWRYFAIGLPAIALIVVGAMGFTRRDVRAA